VGRHRFKRRFRLLDAAAVCSYNARSLIAPATVLPRPGAPAGPCPHYTFVSLGKVWCVCAAHPFCAVTAFGVGPVLTEAPTQALMATKRGFSTAIGLIVRRRQAGSRAGTPDCAQAVIAPTMPVRR
jgi:hypothetical protein